MSFKTINLEEYKRLLKNKQKMFDMTFQLQKALINTEIMMIKSIKKFYMMKKSIIKIKIYQKCLIKT